MATRSMPIVSWHAGLDRDLDLGADAVGGGDQHRVLEARALEVEQAAEAADLGIGARPRGRAHQRLDQLHHAVAGVDIDAGLRIGEAAFLLMPLAYVGIRIVCNGSIADILQAAIAGAPGAGKRSVSAGEPGPDV